jgi:anti-anti-sigma factor
MAFKLRAVSVKQLPESLDSRQWQSFFREVESCMNVDRPCVVLDCSRVRRMGSTSTNLLLCCLEEAMKRNGDVKLAAVPPDARTILELTGVDGLFEIFDTSQSAIDSFHRRAAFPGSHFGPCAGMFDATQNAA